MGKKKDKLMAVELRLPNETLQYLNAVAVLAGVSTEQVVNVILAFDAMRHRIAEAGASK